MLYMTFYQELQLDQAGSKKLIQNTEGLKNKLRHTTVYLFKIFLTIVFCVAFVSAYSGIFGSENSIVGVVVLLCLMVFRFADYPLGLPQQWDNFLNLNSHHKYQHPFSMHTGEFYTYYRRIQF